MNEKSPWEPGWQCGPPDRPDEYVLVHHLTTGGEGEVWRASRRHRDGTEGFCALKILQPRSVDDHPQGHAAWRERWADSVHRGAALEIPGLATPVHYFVGSLPRPAHRRPSGEQIPYLISPWLDGTPADRWAQSSPADAVTRAGVLRALCVIVDRLHDRGYVHRDISGGNVLVTEDGQVRLIDLTYLAPLGRGLTRVVHTPGYAPAGEELSDRRPDPARDRYAVGALARRLLLPDLDRLTRNEDASRATHRQLLAAGYPVEVADCLARALDPDPTRRPSPLTAWAEELCTLLAAARDAPHVCVGVLPGAVAHPTVVTGGPSGVRAYGLPGLLPELPPLAPGAPRSVNAVACLLDPGGRPAVAATDTRGSLWLGTADRWRELGGDARGVVALTVPGAPALIWTGHIAGVTAYRWCAGTEPTVRSVPAPSAATVLAAARDHRGRPCVLVGLNSSVELWTWSEPAAGDPVRRPVSDAPARRGALALNTWGELEAALLRPDGRRETWCDHFADGWLLMDEPSAAAADTVAVALCGNRRLSAQADATAAGVTVTTSVHDCVPWRIPGPALDVALSQTSDGRLLAVCLTEDGPWTVWEEWTGVQGPVQRLEMVRGPRRPPAHR
ncbi:serine/threonine protein kinase [Streptomyces sp. NPDC059176]|uniref:serine/threonine protein kinase n=1 Tax=Streptomyces sp. NPDC059176 TaxID=3346758 RepID=UPI0036BFDCA8